MGGNYPPGVDAGHPYFNPPDHSHEHEWWDVDGPIFEDGAAMFYADCNYAEGRYGEGWECEESRWWRCDVTEIIKRREGAPNISYLPSAEDPDSWGHIEWLFETVLLRMECEPPGAYELIDVDPANEHGDGFVRVQISDYEIVYEQ